MPKIGDTYPVTGPDHARELAAKLCLKTGKIVIGSAEWNENGTGTITIEKIID